MADFKQGDRVSWNTSQGRTRGKVVAVRTSDFDIEGTHLTASKDSPKVEVESEKSGKRAGHAPGALRKLKS
jgi:hypothetical protein